MFFLVIVQRIRCGAVMRLTDLQRTIIRETVAETFGVGANVWLFGSRVKDNQRGGDIDLLIETDQVDAETIARAEIAFLAKFQMRMEEQKIDVLLDYPSRSSRPPIYAVAKQIGILL
ncbi:nucleotidyltransferase domain-containing protein [Nitrosomonas oligotropha]|uniref:Nucleotidyltransferase domain-containing protein n=1 Tax=Nitrosomonas oligotropha TaxID=42354 RepID=A0A1H8PKF9_9PROT|nr:nucleotidyltransferase domain-containing protein [Nitrosomonas oligotropha]SDX40499.1 Nucleotidyltransferase domain-containing protein [Nitrosomonas oligotropha]SEO42395.1 Nucleotidyltransferase domain-containing protein [Nitrosomonas oligotropha]